MRKISSLKDKLLDDMKNAMKAKDRERLSVIRMARASIKNVEIEKRKDLDDNEVIEVLAKEVKQRQDSISEYKKLGKEDEINKLEKEIEVLKDYLPRQLTRKEIENIVDQVIKRVDASSLADMGKVMGTIMPEVKGKADGRLISEIVKDKLS